MKKHLKHLPVLAIFILIGVFYWFWSNRSVSADTVSPKLSDSISVASVSGSTTTDNLQPTALSWPPNKTISAKILMYHHIGDAPAGADATRLGLTVSAANFEAQMKYLKDQKYNVVTMADLYRQVAQSSLKSKTAVLTFDDSYDDNTLVALPILQKYGFAATFYIISGDLGKTGYMTQDQVKNVSSAGNEIGSHTVDHPDLTIISAKKMSEEVVNSKKTLEDLIGAQVISFCYPSGKFNAGIEAEVKAAGYKTATATTKGGPFSSNNPFEIPRYRISPTTNLESLLHESS